MVSKPSYEAFSPVVFKHLKYRIDQTVLIGKFKGPCNMTAGLLLYRVLVIRGINC